MEKSLTICTDPAQADYTKAYLIKRGAKVTVENIHDFTVSEATGTPPDVDFDGKYTKMGDGLILVTGTW